MAESEKNTWPVSPNGSMAGFPSFPAGGKGAKIPPLFSKKWLCQYYDIPLGSGRTGSRLRRLVFTDEVLAEMGLSEEAWKKRRTFTAHETLIIRKHLEL